MRKTLFGFLFLTLPAWAQPATPEPPPLVASDEQTQFTIDGKHWSPAVAAEPFPGWPVMKDAKWLWTALRVTPDEAFSGSPIITFRRSYTAKSTGRATLRITADNAYEASFNGKLLGSNGVLDAKSSSDQDWTTFDTYDVPLKAGVNLLTIRAINYHSPGGTHDPHWNPAGVVFKLMPSTSLSRTVTAGGKAEVYGIHFDIDKSTIKPDSKPVLAEIAAMMKGNPALKVEISGHTDSTGSADHNKTLSQQRADAVVTALNKDYGVAAGRMTAAGYGNSRPVGDNATVDGRTQNRRVEIRRL